MLGKFIQWKLEMFGKFLTATSGWKTYTAGSLMLAYAVIGLIFKFHEIDVASEIAIGALALFGIAHKADKIIKK